MFCSARSSLTTDFVGLGVKRVSGGGSESSRTCGGKPPADRVTPAAAATDPLSAPLAAGDGPADNRSLLPGGSSVVESMVELDLGSTSGMC